MLEVELTGKRDTEVTKPQRSHLRLQKHSLGGCNVDMPQSARYTLFNLRMLGCDERDPTR